ncbi:MAG: hypothetical protein ACT4NP_01475 [Pseudonocardiales bacterium]
MSAGHTGHDALPDPFYPHVSPYMLYRLAGRYDEFEGESDVGSSLRGAFKGWFNHGVLLEADWPEPVPQAGSGRRGCR